MQIYLDYQKHKKLLLGIISVIFISFLIRTAWICDDAMITFRSAMNFNHGYGMGWNITERVQAFTHPLWFFIISITSFLSGEIFYTTIFASITLSTATIILLISKVSRSISWAIIGLTAISLSKSFVEFSTSGLENPLSHLMLMTCIILLYNRQEKDFKRLFLLVFTASLTVLSRFDLALIITPAIIAFAIPSYGYKQIFKAVIIGSIPLTLWLLFSTLYFGFPFPNTAYAKLSTGIPSSELISQGFIYLLDSFSRDPITLTTILLTSIIAITHKKLMDIAITIGIALYLIYIIKIGGDFMSGRFISAPFIVAVAVLCRQKSINIKFSAGIAVIILALGVAHKSPAIFNNDSFSKRDYKKTGIADERGYYYQKYGLLNYKRKGQIDIDDWGYKGRIKRVRIKGAIGRNGLTDGPEVHIIDYHALSDPLLSRLEQKAGTGWRIGHFRRRLPKGYKQSIIKDMNLIEDKNLSKYYDKIRIITRDSIWSKERLFTIIKMNIGSYDHLLHNEYDPVSITVDAKEMTVKRTGTKWNAAGNKQFYHMNVAFKKATKAKMIDISLDHNDRYIIEFESEDNKTASLKIEPKNPVRGGGLRRYMLSLPKDIKGKKIKKLTIEPIDGDGKYSLGHIRLI
ncbi:MAG: hypothetical protein D6B27_00120 [Gammaproteobacteria bacterium]|nr:MAG: hypothetical protein D6B27_00120 [Gammaproteobacteria bacterium]